MMVLESTARVASCELDPDRALRWPLTHVVLHCRAPTEDSSRMISNGTFSDEFLFYFGATPSCAES